MEIFKKIIQLIGNILAIIGRIPVFLLPKNLKGYRTELFNILAAALVFLEGFDITGVANAICGLFGCDASVINEAFIVLVTAVNVALRRKTDTAPHVK